MRPFANRRLLGFALAAVALAAGGCERKQRDSFDVVVIGGQPSLSDPAIAATLKRQRFTPTSYRA